MDLAKPSLAMPMATPRPMPSLAFTSRNLTANNGDSLYFGARTSGQPRKINRLAAAVLLLLTLAAGKTVVDFASASDAPPAASASAGTGHSASGTHAMPTPAPSGRPSRADRNAARDIRRDLKDLNFYNHQDIALAIGEVQNPRLKAELIMDYLDAAAGEGHNAALYGTAVSVYFLEYGGRAQTLLWNYGNLPNNAAVRAGARADILAEIP